MSLVLLAAMLLLAPWDELRAAETLARKGRPHEAVVVYRRLAAHPDLQGSSAFWLNFGHLQVFAGEDAGAIDSYRRSLRRGGTAAALAWQALQEARRRHATASVAPERASVFEAVAVLMLKHQERLRLGLMVLFAVFVSGLVFSPALPEAWRVAARGMLCLLAVCLATGWVLLVGFTPPEFRDGRGTWVVVREPVLARQGNGLSYPAAGKAPLAVGTEGWLRAARGNGWVQVEWPGGNLAWVPQNSILLGPTED